MFRQCLRLNLDQRLMLEQKLKIQNRILSLRLQLIGKIHGETYKPHAICPKCFRRLTLLEIIKGFKRDVNDYTTKCPRCGDRFEPKLSCKGKAYSITLPFLCPMQTLDQMKGKEKKSPTEIRESYPTIYSCANVHFGGLAQAFKEIRINYRFQEPVIKWEKKVKHFLGLLPDSVIARLVHLKYAEVRKLRLHMGIPRYRASDFV